MVRKLDAPLKRNGREHDWETLLDGSPYEVTERQVGDLIKFRRAAYNAAQRRGLSATVQLDGKKARLQAFPKESD